MLTIADKPYQLCDGLSRREWLRVGSLGVFGLGMPSLLAGRTALARGENTPSSFGRAKSCIVLFLIGGPPQHETWDPKPDAPAEIRGDLGPISSSVPGLSVGELMPQVARHAHRVAVLRAVSTNDNAHSSSGYWMLTGTPHQPMNSENAKPGAPNDWPSTGAIVQQLRPSGMLPAAITIPEELWNTGRIVWPGQDGGFLGRSAHPWLLTCDPNEQGFTIPGLSLPGEVPPLRFEGRRSLLESIDHHLQRFASAGALARWNNLGQQTFELLRSPQAQHAFDLAREPAAMREHYGRNRFGQSVLLARRLVEAGVSLVQVNWTRASADSDINPVWDTHAKNAERLRTALMPPMDLAYSALLEDLAERGLLDETLVVWMGEFGRSPKINPAAGRDHWGHVYSAALAGGGVRGGHVHGASDRIGAFPAEGRIEPQDLTATIFHCLGLHPETEMHDRLGRPFPISRGRVIAEVLS